MKKISLHSTTKYTLSVLLTIALTVGWVYAWAGLTASTGDKLDAAKWNALVSTVQSGMPTGAVMAFNLASCPSGWTEYTAGAGRSIIGVGAGAGLTARTLGETGGAETVGLSISNLPSHSHSAAFSAPSVSLSVITDTPPLSGTPLLTNGQTAYLANASAGSAGNNLKGLYNTNAPVAGSIASIPANVTGGSVNISPTWASAPINKMQPYVALLYCQKN